VCFIRAVNQTHTISTLLYCFNEQDEVLLMERAQEPNLGVWSPPGGKLHTVEGESPHACAAREALEELGLFVKAADLHLTGIISESHFSGRGHWLMFLFEIQWKLTSLPPAHREGRFEFVAREKLKQLKVPATDREQIWPLFWKHRGGFFAAQCRIVPPGRNEWTLEESRHGSADH
jgi:8-oxo-dGTP diphosphatase